MKKQRFAILLEVILAVSLCSGLLAGQPNGKIVCFGDSITHAGGYGWVEMIAGEHPEATMVNAGRSGRKTSDIDELPGPLAANSDADWILFFLGVNDLRDGTPEMVAQCVSNMDWMIHQAEKLCPSARIVLMAPTGLSLGRINEINRDKKYNRKTQDSLVLIEQEYRALADKRGIGFVSLLNEVSPENFYDGLHPDRNGQREISRSVWQGLVNLASRAD